MSNVILYTEYSTIIFPALVASSLLEDNKNVKVVFAIRQPTERVYSNYKFSYETYGSKGSMDYLVETGMKRDDKFGRLIAIFHAV